MKTGNIRNGNSGGAGAGGQWLDGQPDIPAKSLAELKTSVNVGVPQDRNENFLKLLARAEKASQKNSVLGVSDTRKHADLQTAYALGLACLKSPTRFGIFFQLPFWGGWAPLQTEVFLASAVFILRPQNMRQWCKTVHHAQILAHYAARGVAEADLSAALSAEPTKAPHCQGVLHFICVQPSGAMSATITASFDQIAKIIELGATDQTSQMRIMATGRSGKVKVKTVKLLKPSPKTQTIKKLAKH
jgi:hypothetical protein